MSLRRSGFDQVMSLRAHTIAHQICHGRGPVRRAVREDWGEYAYAQTRRLLVRMRCYRGKAWGHDV